MWGKTPGYLVGRMLSRYCAGVRSLSQLFRVEMCQSPINRCPVNHKSWHVKLVKTCSCDWSLSYLLTERSGPKFPSNASCARKICQTTNKMFYAVIWHSVPVQWNFVAYQWTAEQKSLQYHWRLQLADGTRCVAERVRSSQSTRRVQECIRACGWHHMLSATLFYSSPITNDVWKFPSVLYFSQHLSRRNRSSIPSKGNKTSVFKAFIYLPIQGIKRALPYRVKWQEHEAENVWNYTSTSP